MKIVGIIPARFKSSRFPGKPLALILGKPMIIWVCEIVEKALGNENTFVATDDERIANIVIKNGFQVVMTSDGCKTGTDRLWDAAQKINSDIYLNIQGDEPMLNPDEIIRIANVKKEFPEYIINGMAPLMPEEDPLSVNIPKVLANNKGELIYISRLPIPGIKASGTPTYYKQVCIYAFNYEQLQLFGTCPEKAIYELYEDIEILRFFDLGIKIKMVEMKSSSLAVDIPNDIISVETAIRNTGNKNR